VLHMCRKLNDEKGWFGKIPAQQNLHNLLLRWLALASNLHKGEVTVQTNWKLPCMDRGLAW
jgi:hypothetical protein